MVVISRPPDCQPLQAHFAGCSKLLAICGPSTVQLFTVRSALGADNRPTLPSASRWICARGLPGRWARASVQHEGERCLTRLASTACALAAAAWGTQLHALDFACAAVSGGSALDPELLSSPASAAACPVLDSEQLSDRGRCTTGVHSAAALAPEALPDTRASVRQVALDSLDGCIRDTSGRALKLTPDADQPCDVLPLVLTVLVHSPSGLALLTFLYTASAAGEMDPAMCTCAGRHTLSSTLQCVKAGRLVKGATPAGPDRSGQCRAALVRRQDHAVGSC